MEMKQKQTFCRGTYSNLTLCFVGHKISKHFNDMLSEIKSHGTCANLAVFFLIYKVVYYLNDF